MSCLDVSSSYNPLGDHSTDPEGHPEVEAFTVQIHRTYDLAKTREKAGKKAARKKATLASNQAEGKRDSPAVGTDEKSDDKDEWEAPQSGSRIARTSRNKTDDDEHEITVTHCAFSPTQHSLVAYCDDEGHVTVQDLNKPGWTDSTRGCFKDHDRVNCVDFSADGSMLAVGGGMSEGTRSADRLKVYLVDKISPALRDGTSFPLVRAYAAEHTILDLSFASSGELAYGGVMLPLKIMEGPTKHEQEIAGRVFQPAEANMHANMADDGIPRSCCGTRPPTDLPLKLRAQELFATRSGGKMRMGSVNNELKSVSFSPGPSKYLACLSKDGELLVMMRNSSRLWTQDNAVELCYSREESQESPTNVQIVDSAVCRFSPELTGLDGEKMVLIAVGLMNDNVIVREARTGHLRYVLDCGGPCHAVAFSTEMRGLLAVATTHGIRIYDALTGANAFEFLDEKHFMRSKTVCFSPSGFAIAYGIAGAPSSFAFNSLRTDATQRVVMTVDGTNFHKAYSRSKSKSNSIGTSALQNSQENDRNSNGPENDRSNGSRQVNWQRVEKTVELQNQALHSMMPIPVASNEQCLLSDAAFTSVAVAQSPQPNQSIVVASITSTGELMACEYGVGRGSFLLRQQSRLQENTKVISSKCVALSPDGAFIAYESCEPDGGSSRGGVLSGGSEDRHLVVKKIEISENAFQLTAFDRKDIREGGVPFARTAFSCGANMLVCYNEAREIAV